ncbi:MAG: hypothetical protein KAS71_02465 [Bacteroidales bacterium]|nr:hypothetical protein [Bacteroidales bacterium]
MVKTAYFRPLQLLFTFQKADFTISCIPSVVSHFYSDTRSSTFVSTNLNQHNHADLYLTSDNNHWTTSPDPPNGKKLPNHSLVISDYHLLLDWYNNWKYSRIVAKQRVAQYYYRGFRFPVHTPFTVFSKFL